MDSHFGLQCYLRIEAQTWARAPTSLMFMGPLLQSKSLWHQALILQLARRCGLHAVVTDKQPSRLNGNVNDSQLLQWQELATQWGVLLEALTAGDHPRIADATLRYAFLWYNFMPLARGTAVVGYISLLAVFLAAGMPITTPAPRVSCAAAAPAAPMGVHLSGGPVYAQLPLIAGSSTMGAQYSNAGGYCSWSDLRHRKLVVS